MPRFHRDDGEDVAYIRHRFFSGGSTVTCGHYDLGVIRCGRTISISARALSLSLSGASGRPDRMRDFFRRWSDLDGEDPASFKNARGPEAVREAHPSGRGQLFAAMLEAMGDPPPGAAFPTFDWMHGMMRWRDVLPNLWLDTSVSDQVSADARIPDLLAAPAAVRFLSAEPLLGTLDLEPWLDWPDGGTELPDGRFFGCADCEMEVGPRCECPRDRSYYHVEEGPRDSTGCPEYVHAERMTLDWVIVGGESGRGARPMHPVWARSLRDQCQAAGVAFFLKQWGKWGVAPVLPPLEGDLTFWPDGNFGRGGANEKGGLGGTLRRVGKKAAGRLLDGREWSEVPAIAVEP